MTDFASFSAGEPPNPTIKKMDTPERPAAAVLILLLAYGAASLFHYAHNAEFLADYPSMPDWFSPATVYAAWFAVTALGLIGYLLFRRGYALSGLSVIAAYAALGFDGLGHYSLAPFAEHTATMNFAIGLEVATAALLLATVASAMAKRVWARQSKIAAPTPNCAKRRA